MLSQLVQLTGGHPLFLREILAVMLEQAALHRQPVDPWDVDLHQLGVAQHPDMHHTITTRPALHDDALALIHLAQVAVCPLSVVVECAHQLTRRHLVQSDALGYRCGHAMLRLYVSHYRHTSDGSSTRAGLPRWTRRFQRSGVHSMHSLSDDGTRQCHCSSRPATPPVSADYGSALHLLDQALQALDQASLPAAQHDIKRTDVLLERQLI